MSNAQERPIHLDAGDVRAILDASQSQFVRLLRPQPVFEEQRCWYPTYSAARAKHYGNEKHFRKGMPIDFSPYGKPGDHL